MDTTVGGGHWLPEVGWQVRQIYREARGLPDDPVSDLRRLLGQYVAAQDEADLDMVTLWIAATHLAARGVGQAFPRLAIVAPSYGAGKSTALGFVTRLSHRGETITSGISDALIPRLLQSEGFVTLCFDEADKTLHPDNRGATAVLNSGWERGAVARVNMPSADGGWTPARIDVFAPVALAGNGVRLAADTRERTLTVRLVRTEGTPEVRWADELEGVDERLRARLEAWAELAASDVRVKRPSIPDGLTGRDRDRWAVLLSAARGVGGPWPAKAAELATADREARAAEAEAAGVARNEQIAHDLREVWREGETWAPSGQLVERLIVANPETWGVPSGRALTAKALGWKLREYYGITPERFGAGVQRQRGYSRPQMAKVWKAVGIGDCA